MMMPYRLLAVILAVTGQAAFSQTNFPSIPIPAREVITNELAVSMFDMTKQPGSPGTGGSSIPASPSPLQQFGAIKGNFESSSPPDPMGAVGKNHVFTQAEPM
jgi:hypothetical protein